jgi:hypothetical protein
VSSYQYVDQFVLSASLLAWIALANSIFRGLEAHFCFEHQAQGLRDGLKAIRKVDNLFEELMSAESHANSTAINRDDFETFKREYDHAMKKTKPHLA